MSGLVLSGRARRTLGGLGATVLFVIAATALPAAAATGATLLLSSAAPASRVGVELSAQVVGAAATPMAGLTVNFYVHLIEFSGAPELLIGSASTNAAGVASITYQPTWAGTQRFVATAVDGAGSALATSSLSVQAARTDRFAGSVQSPRPDGLIGRWVVMVLLALVISVWITLLALVVRVQQGPVQIVQYVPHGTPATRALTPHRGLGIATTVRDRRPVVEDATSDARKIVLENSPDG